MAVWCVLTIVREQCGVFFYLVMRNVAKVGDLVESCGMYANAADASDMSGGLY